MRKIMLSKITSFALRGLEGIPVEVETDIKDRKSVV